jgi:excisionase family DNA binding protein
MEIIQEKLETICEALEMHSILSKEVITLEEAAKYLQISKSCLYKLTGGKEIPHYVPGGKKIYFRKSELDSWIFNSKVNSISEMLFENEEYLGRNNKYLRS